MKVLSTSTYNKTEFIDAMEAYNYPIFAVIYHPEIGNLGLWLPGTALETGDVGRYMISFEDGARTKVAAAPESLRKDSRIRAIMTIEDPSHAQLQILV